MDILHIDPKTLAIQIGAFCLLLIVFRVYLFKPILAILDARRREVEARYVDAEAQKRSADELRAEYEQRLAGIEDELRAEVAQAVKDGHAMREEIIAESRARADQILDKARLEIEHERAKAVVELKATVAKLAITAASRLVREKLDDKKHHELVEQFIDDLDEVSG